MAPRNKRKAARPQDPAIPKRARNHRTKQDPWEKSREDDEALEVEAILRVEYRRGLPFYEVHWKGWSSETTETTLEPAENLVGAAQLVREFNVKAYAAAASKAQKVAIKAAKDARAEENKRKQEQEAAAAQADAVEQALAEPDSQSRQEGTPDVITPIMRNGRVVLHKHRHKTSPVWDTFDLSKEQPTCTVAMSADGGLCGCKPASTGGTSNYWGHLFAHHRPIWLEKKRAAGQLTDVGQAELATLAESMEALRQKNKTGSVKASLDPKACEVLNKLAV